MMKRTISETNFPGHDDSVSMTSIAVRKLSHSIRVDETDFYNLNYVIIYFNHVS